MTESIHDLEREIEQSRAKLDLSIDRLQGRLSPTGLLDDLIGYSHQSRYGAVTDAALHAIKRNPLPVFMIAVGVSWFLYRLNREQARPLLPSPSRMTPLETDLSRSEASDTEVIGDPGGYVPKAASTPIPSSPVPAHA